MNNLMKTISCALSNQYDASLLLNINWKDVYLKSKEHLLHHVLFDFYNDFWTQDFKQSELYIRWREEYLFHVLDHSISLYKTFEILKELELKKIEFIILKGPVVNELYRNSKTRIMNDIDILINRSDLEYVDNFFIKKSFTLIDKSDKDYVYYNSNYTKIEVHYSLFHKKHYTDFEWFQRHCFNTKVRKNNLPGYVLSEENSYIYLMLHASKHIYSTGIGLRSLYDIGAYYRLHSLKFNSIYVCETLKYFKKHIISEYILYLGNYLFRFNNQVSIEIKCSVAMELLEMINESGAYGHRGEHQIDMIYINNLRKKNVTYTKIKLFFLPLDDMRKRFGILNKYPFLLPIYWIKRGYFIFTKNNELTQRFISKKIDKPNIMSKIELLEALED